MKPRILLLGKNGQVGFDLSAVLPAVGDVTALGHSELDLSKPGEIRRVVRDVRPNIIINAAAYTAVDQAESDENTARAINTDAPRLLAEEGRKIGSSLIHYSTDYVFDGTKTSPYIEVDATNPLNVYGRTKLEGEQAIRATGIPHLIFRTSWIYSTRGRNFLLTILRLATQREKLRIVSDQTGAPTRSLSIARTTAAIVACKMGNDGTLPDQISGTYHMTAGGETNWHRFAIEVCTLAKAAGGLEWIIKATNGQPFVAEEIVSIRTEDYPTPARRPLYSVMSNCKFAETLGTPIADWHRELIECFTASDPSTV